MRILSFVEGAPLKAGGLGLVGVPYICHALASRGHHVVLNICGPIIPSAVDLIQRQTSFLKGSFDVITYPAYQKWAFSPALLMSLKRLGKDADIIMLHSLYSFPVLAGYFLARTSNVPYAIHPHGVLAPFQRRVSPHKKWLYDSVIAGRILNQAAVIIYSAEHERVEARSLKLNASSVVVPHGIDMTPFQQLPSAGVFRDEYLNGHEGPLILYLGRLNAKKGLDLLIRTAARVVNQMPQARFALVGGADPPSFNKLLQDWISQEGLQERVVMTGIVSDETKLAALADADIFVLPSYAENFGFAMFEAMASRLPVIISADLNMASEVQSYQAGIIAERKPEQFAHAITALIRDDVRRKAMGENGFRMAQAYSWDEVGQRLEQALQSVLTNVPFPPDLRPQ